MYLFIFSPCFHEPEVLYVTDYCRPPPPPPKGCGIYSTTHRHHLIQQGTTRTAPPLFILAHVVVLLYCIVSTSIIRALSLFSFGSLSLFSSLRGFFFRKALRYRQMASRINPRVYQALGTTLYRITKYNQTVVLLVGNFASNGDGARCRSPQTSRRPQEGYLP